MAVHATRYSPSGCEIMRNVPRSPDRCIDIVSSNRCPLSVAGCCSVRGTRIRLPQHVGYPQHINTDWTTSCEQDHPTASFLGLPREIRDAIYAFALPTNETFHLGHLVLDFDQKLSHVHQIHPARAPASWLPLFSTSKQLHSEAANHLFSSNAFSMCFHPDGRHLDASVLDTFQFRDLVPLHPMYTRFVREVELGLPTQRGLCDPISIRCPEGPHIGTPPAISEEQVHRFMQTTQSSLDAAISCKCLRLIALGSGTYTLRRPPGREREKCRRATLRRIEPYNSPVIERMRRGEFDELPDRHKMVHTGECTTWDCASFLCVVCVLSVVDCCLKCVGCRHETEGQRMMRENDEARWRELRAREE